MTNHHHYVVLIRDRHQTPPATWKPRYALATAAPLAEVGTGINLCVQGMGGWMAITGAPDGPPQQVGDNLGDSIPGLWTALGVVLALETRRQTGQGQYVDMAMYECMAAHTIGSMAWYQATGQAPGRDHGEAINAQLTLKARDGYVVLAGAGPAEKWIALWRLIGREELIQDPRYLGQGATGEFYIKQFVPAIEAWSQHLPMLEVAEKLMEIGFSMGMAQNVADLDRCPHLEARQMFVESDNTLGGRFRSLKTPIRLTSCVDAPNGTPPALGSANQEVLCGIGGLTAEELAQLQSEGVI